MEIWNLQQDGNLLPIPTNYRFICQIAQEVDSSFAYGIINSYEGNLSDLRNMGEISQNIECKERHYDCAFSICKG